MQSVVEREGMLKPEPGPAPLIRRAFQDAKVFTVSLIGGFGCGKTSLIEATAKRLLLELHVGIIACHPGGDGDADRLARIGHRFLAVDVGRGLAPAADQIHEALGRLDLTSLDLLLIEDVGSLLESQDRDLGQDARVCMFSTTEGEYQPTRYANLVKSAAAVVLNKIDLLPAVPFNLPSFRDTVRRLNPLAPLFEVSALSEEGIDPWLAWLRRQARPRSGGTRQLSTEMPHLPGALSRGPASVRSFEAGAMRTTHSGTPLVS